MPEPMPCAVCVEGGTESFRTSDGLSYHRCRACGAVMLDASHWLDEQAERARYELHENDPDDPGYRGFLARLATPLLERLPASSDGLDFGCGPGPALARMLEEAGHRVALYDPFFHADASALERAYDFIACTETVEHFRRPADEFARFDALLRPGGILAIMTSLLTDEINGGADIPVGDRRASRKLLRRSGFGAHAKADACPTDAFDDWHYRKDPTHIVFYRERTFRVIADRFGWACECPAKDIVILRKDGTS